jgi:phosphoglycerate dehydrogenase-like enzyme
MDQIALVIVTNLKEGTPPLLDRMPEHVKTTIGMKAEDFDSTIADTDVIFTWGAKRDILEQLLPKARKLKWIHSRSAGLDSQLFPALAESPVPLTNGRGVFSQSLGEFAIAGALFFAKDLRRMLRNQEAGRWEQFNVTELRGKTMGIVGYGDIGRAVAQRAQCMGMEVLALRRNPALSAGDTHVTRLFGFDALHEMLPLCDYVVAAAPLTPETKHLIGAPEFAVMKPAAIVMNVGRGPVIDEAAMVHALQTKQIRGAALDVFEVEPLPPESPLWKMQNVLLSPHCADNTEDWLEQAMLFFYANLERFRKGEPLVNVVDKHRGY